jgi:hypothetical protein
MAVLGSSLPDSLMRSTMSSRHRDSGGGQEGRPRNM